MTKMAAMLVCVMLFTSMPYVGQSYAADEDTQASVYLVFDPETGEFVTVDDPSVTAQHAQKQIQEEIDSGTAAATSGDAATAAGDGAGKPPMTLVIGGVVVALILGGFVWMRRSRQGAA